MIIDRGLICPAREVISRTEARSNPLSAKMSALWCSSAWRVPSIVFTISCRRRSRAADIGEAFESPGDHLSPAAPAAPARRALYWPGSATRRRWTPTQRRDQSPGTAPARPAEHLHRWREAHWTALTSGALSARGRPCSLAAAGREARAGLAALSGSAVATSAWLSRVGAPLSGRRHGTARCAP